MKVEWVDTGGGHIIVALFVFLVGVAMSVWGVQEGKEITVGALASLWTSLRIQKRAAKKGDG